MGPETLPATCLANNCSASGPSQPPALYLTVRATGRFYNKHRHRCISLWQHFLCSEGNTSPNVWMRGEDCEWECVLCVCVCLITFEIYLPLVYAAETNFMNIGCTRYHCITTTTTTAATKTATFGKCMSARAHMHVITHIRTSKLNNIHLLRVFLLPSILFCRA